MCLSKNVLREREAPEQIVLGANDSIFCPLIAIAILCEFQYTQDSFLPGVEAKSSRKRAVNQVPDNRYPVGVRMKIP